jgi:HAMP domain-containing protein
MKSILKKVFWVLLVAFVLIQFIRPAKNTATALSANDISTKYKVPVDVQNILQTSCNDCHSNNTIYPWYSNIQPVAWYLADHVKDGKRHLDFSEFASYRIGRQYRKLEEISHEIEDGEMPMTSYTLIHGNAKLNDVQKATIYKWVNELRDSIKANNPEDSLVRKPQKK